MGTDRVGRCWRALPYSIPCQGYGYLIRLELDLELPHFILHAIHHLCNQLQVRLRLCCMQFRWRGHRILLSV